MQLMPSTASFIARDRRYRDRKRHELFEPKVNLHLAEKYIQHLLKEPVVNKSLVRMLMAYNAGPGNLKKWLSKVDHQNDPFLLVESIPARETRFYVKNVISNLAMYRKKFKENSPAIAGLVSGNGGIFNLNEAKKLFQ